MAAIELAWVVGGMGVGVVIEGVDEEEARVRAEGARCLMEEPVGDGKSNILLSSPGQGRVHFARDAFISYILIFLANVLMQDYYYYVIFSTIVFVLRDFFELNRSTHGMKSGAS